MIKSKLKNILNMNISYEIMLQLFFISLCHFYLIKKQRTVSYLNSLWQVLHVHSIHLLCCGFACTFYWPGCIPEKKPSGNVPSVIRATAVTWLNYCQYGVKLYPINQSINQYSCQESLTIYKMQITFLTWFRWRCI